MDTLAPSRHKAALDPHSSAFAGGTDGPRLAYLLSRYPALSHTFFLKEVLGLRARGLHIETASINPPDRPLASLPAQEAEEARNTFYIKNGDWLVSLLSITAIAMKRPAVLMRGLATVFKMHELTLRQHCQWLFYLAEALLVGRWMQARKLEHLHVHFGGPVASVGMLTSIAWRVPYSLTIHGPEELLDVRAYQLQEKLAQASFVFCISDFCRSQLCQLSPAGEWSKFSVVRLGVDPLTLVPRERRMDISETVQIVCTGRLVAAKGHRILLQALDSLRKRGIRFHATFIGAGPEHDDIERFLLRHKMQSMVTLTSGLSHAETLGIVSHADIFSLASFAEGIPVALMEAMSLGVPCVSTTIAGIPELIRNGVDGILVPPANVDALAEALEALATDPRYRLFLGDAGRRRIISDYNLPLHQERLVQCFADRFAEMRSNRGSTAGLHGVPR